MIILHVFLAVASLVLSTINFISPGAKKSVVSYGLATGTLASGVVLIVVNNASVLRTCLTGLVFFGIVSIMNQAASRKLTKSSNL